MLKFNDGMSFNTDDPPRVTSRSDGLYVVGLGCLIPVNSLEEATTVIASMTGDKNAKRNTR